jgi:hydroxyquinol 1,2-dioxygenase
MRPAHIHFRIAADGYETLTTHVFAAGDPFLDTDAVFGVKESLIAPFVSSKDAHTTLEFDFVLARKGP